MSSYLYDRSKRGLSLLVPPVVEPITLALAKSHLRVDITEDDDYIEQMLIPTARDVVERYTRRALYKQQWCLTLDRFPTWGDTDDPYFWLYRRGIIDLTVSPIMSIDKLAWVDTAGAEWTLSPSLKPPTVTAAAGSGVLPAGTYAYRVSFTTKPDSSAPAGASTYAGETLPSVEVTQTLDDVGGVILTWAADSRAAGVNVYGRGAGAEQLLASLPAGSYTWTDDGSGVPAGPMPTVNTSGFFNVDIQDDYVRLEPVYGYFWPITQFRITTVKITYTSGYTDGIVNGAPPAAGDPQKKIPYPIKMAMLLLIAHMYENREIINMSMGGGVLPFGVEDLLGPYRSIRF